MEISSRRWWWCGSASVSECQSGLHYYRFRCLRFFFATPNDTISIGPTYAFQSHQMIGLFSILNFHTHFVMAFVFSVSLFSIPQSQSAAILVTSVLRIHAALQTNEREKKTERGNKQHMYMYERWAITITVYGIKIKEDGKCVSYHEERREYRIGCVVKTREQTTLQSIKATTWNIKQSAIHCKHWTSTHAISSQSETPT